MPEQPIKIEMDAQGINDLIEFLGRVELKGREVPRFNYVTSQIRKALPTASHSGQDRLEKKDKTTQ